MFIAYAVVAVLLAFGLTLSARGKLVRSQNIVETLTGIGVPITWFPWLATCEIAAAVGLLAGLIYRPLGLAAAICLVVYFVGAVFTHLRVRDYKGLGAPSPILALAIVVLVLRILAKQP